MIAHKGLLPALTVLTGDASETVREHASFVLSALATDVALNKGMEVKQVLERVLSTSSHRKRLQPRHYSPTSVSQFNFDFEAIGCFA